MYDCCKVSALLPDQVAQLEADMEDATRRKAAADLEVARALEAARSDAAAAQLEAEVLRAGAGADKDSALAALKVPDTLSPGLSSQSIQEWQSLEKHHHPCRSSQSPCHC